MPSTEILIISGLLGALISLVSTVLIYWRGKKRISNIWNILNEENKDLMEKIQEIPHEELLKTEAGNKLLALINSGDYDEITDAIDFEGSLYLNSSEIFEPSKSGKKQTSQPNNISNGQFTKSLIQAWRNYLGRNKKQSSIVFPNASLISDNISIQIDNFGTYIPLYPDTIAILTSSTGKQHILRGGGIVNFSEKGDYILQFVDMKSRSISLPQVTETTRDGLAITLTTTVMIRVAQPQSVVTHSSPLDDLIVITETIIKQYIRAHSHCEIICENENSKPVDDEEITHYILHKLSQHPICKMFNISSVVINSRAGHPEVMKRLEQRALQKFTTQFGTNFSEEDELSSTIIKLFSPRQKNSER